MDPCKTKSVETGKNRTSRSVCFFAKLPDTIIVEIFLKIPFITLAQCFCVCKSWFRILSDPQFAQLRYSTETSNIFLCNNKSKLSILIDGHLGFAASFPPIEWQFVNSCNGLVCMRWQLCIYILNPITGQIVSFPPATGTIQMLFCGFGYCPNTNQYKLFRVVYYETLREKESGDWECPVAEVYTLGTGTWRRIDSAHFEDAYLAYDQYLSHTYLNGCLYWVAMSHCFYFHALESFDLEAEQFQSYPNGDKPFYFPDDFLGLGTFGSDLYACNYEEPNFDFDTEYEEPNGIEVFLLSKGSWTKHTVVKLPRDQLLVQSYNDFVVKYFENGDIMLLQQGELYLCSPSMGWIKSFSDHNLQSSDTVIALAPSLISLRDVLKGERLEVSNVKPWRRVEF